MTVPEPDTGARRAFRAWVRAHHPDTGGNPEEFAAGLARWRAGHAESAARPVPTVTVFQARHELWRVDMWWRRHKRVG